MSAMLLCIVQDQCKYPYVHINVQGGTTNRDIELFVSHIFNVSFSFYYSVYCNKYLYVIADDSKVYKWCECIHFFYTTMSHAKTLQKKKVWKSFEKNPYSISLLVVPPCRYKPHMSALLLYVLTRSVQISVYTIRCNNGSQHQCHCYSQLRYCY